MPFIIAKRGRQNTYYYLVRSIRIDGKVKKHTVAYMSTFPTIEEAYQHWLKVFNSRGKKDPRFDFLVPEYSDIEKLRAKQNLEALEEYRDPAIREAEKETPEEWERRVEKRHERKRADFLAGNGNGRSSLWQWDARQEEAYWRDKIAKGTATEADLRAGIEAYHAEANRRLKADLTPLDAKRALKQLGFAMRGSTLAELEKELKRLKREHLKKFHPDTGGTHETFIQEKHRFGMAEDILNGKLTSD